MSGKDGVVTNSERQFDPSQAPIFRMYPFEELWSERWREYAEAVETGRHQEEFDSLATLEEKANYDAEMFVEAYFKSRETLPQPVALRGIRIDVVQKAASSIPGLIAWTGGEGTRKMLWLGWDESSVKLQCAQQNLIDQYHSPMHRGLKRKHFNGVKAYSAEKKQATEDAIEHRGQVLMGGHILEYHEHRKNPVRRPGIPYIGGSYIINIVDPEIATLYPDQGPRYIDVRASQTPGVYEATYDIQPMGKGVMLFSKYKDTLSAHAEACDAFADAGIRDDPGAFRAFHVGFYLGWTRKQGIMETNQPESPAAKRVREFVTRKTPDSIKRYYMRWRGTGDQLCGFWRMQGRKGRVDQREDGWVEFNEDIGGRLAINFGIGTVDGEFRAYKVENQSHFTGGDWANASKDRWQWIPEFSGSWAT